MKNRDLHRQAWRYPWNIGAALLAVCTLALASGALFVFSDNSASALTTVPTKMNFQGRLTDTSGNIKANGTYNMKLRVYDADSAGTLKYSEERLVSASTGVTLANGLFSLKIGEGSNKTGTFDATLFASGSLYLEVELPTTASATTSSPVWTEGAMTPRNELLTSAYAYNAETLDGLDSAAFAQLGANNTFTGNNIFNGTIQGGTSITAGTTSVAGSLVVTDGSNNTATVTVGNLAGNYIYSIPVTTVNDTFCLQGLANCGSGGGGDVYLANANTFSNTNTINKTSATAFRVQSDAGGATLLTADTSAMKVTINGNLDLSTGKTITIAGDTTANRPSSPNEGMVYYDTTLKQLLTYSNGKWQADRSTSTVIVGTSAAGGVSGAVASKTSDGADFVNTSDASAQTTINTAIASLPSTGGSIYLLDGTYVIDGSISLPNNSRIMGSGSSTILKFKNGTTTNMKGIINTDTSTGTNITIENLLIDGNKDNQSSSVDYMGIWLSGVGNGNTNTARPGAYISNINIKNIYYGFTSNSGIYITASSNSVISQNTLIGTGIYINGSNNVASNNISLGSGQFGIRLTGSNNIISNNTIQNSSYGIELNSGQNNTISSNTIVSSKIDLSNSNGNIVTGNRISDSMGSSENNAINVQTSDSNIITSNIITDVSAQSTNYAINISNSSSDGNYISNNSLGGGSINDIGTATTYNNQVDISGNIVNRGSAGLAINTTTVSSSLSLQGGMTNAQLPTPSSATLTTSGTAGATSRSYQITALDGTGETLPSTIATIATSNATLSSTNRVNVSWPAVPGAVQYKIYRCTGASCTPVLLTTVSTNSYQDISNGTPSGAIPVANTTGNLSIVGTIQGGSSATLGTASVAGSLSISDGSSNNATIVVGSLAGNYNYTLPVITANDTFCMQTLANCGSGGGDVFQANANVFTNTNTINKTSATAFRIQSDSGTTALFTANTSTMTLTVGVADTTGALLVLDTKTDSGDPTGTAGAMYYNQNAGKFRCYQAGAWTDCIGAGGGATRKVTLVPEYNGAVISPDGSNNTGTLTSDFDAVNVHNYYSFTNSTGSLNDYDVVVRNAIPSEYASGFGTFKLWVYNGSTSTASNNIQVTVKDAAGTACAANVSIIHSVANTWSEKTVSLSGCTYAANDIITVSIKMSSASNNAVRIGEMSYQYTN